MSRRFLNFKHYSVSILIMYVKLAIAWLLMEFFLPLFWELKLKATSIQSIIETTDGLIAEVLNTVILILTCLIGYMSLLHFVRLAYVLIITPIVNTYAAYRIHLFFLCGVIHSIINLYIAGALVIRSEGMYTVFHFLTPLLT